MPLLLLLVLLPLVLIAGAIWLLARLFGQGPRLLIAAVAALIAAEVTHGVTIPAVVFVSVILLTQRRRRRRAPRAAEQVLENAPVPRGGASGPGWAELRRLADWGTRRRIDAARATCERYLLLARTQEDPSAQLPIRLAKHVPTLIDDCVRHCRTATPAEARALVADTVATIEGLATRAEARRVELAHQAQGGFRTLKAHLGSAEE